MQEYILHRSGLFLPYKPRPKAIDLFCGAGGFSLGFIQAGFEIVGAVEWEPYAALTYMVNLGSYPIDIHFIDPEDKKRLDSAIERGISRQKKALGVYHIDISGSGWIKYHPEAPPVRDFWFGDIRKIKGQDILDALGLRQGDIDCICGGPPCQGFSKAGKRNVMDPRNSLVFEFARMIIEIQPKTFVFENVPGILNMVTPDGFPVIDKFCRILQDGGFGTMDALKKTLLSTAGAGAALKNGKTSKPTVKGKQQYIESAQISMF